MRILFYVDDGGATGGPAMHSVRIWRALRERWPSLVGPLVVPNEDDRRRFGAQLGEENVRTLAGGGALLDAAADPVVPRPDFFAELCATARREGADHIHVLWGFLHPAQVEVVPPCDRLPSPSRCATRRRAAKTRRGRHVLRRRSMGALPARRPADVRRVPGDQRQDARDALAKGVPPISWRPSTSGWTPSSRRYGATQHDDYVAYVGAFAEYKGLGHVLDFSLLYPEQRVVVCGTLDRLPVDWARYPSVAHRGPPHLEAMRLVARARALLYLSYSEGFGLPMIEAQLLGVPLVVNPRNRMVRELLAPGSYVSAGNVASPTSIKVAVDVAARDREALVAAGLKSSARYDEGRQLDRLRRAILRHHARIREGGWSP